MDVLSTEAEGSADDNTKNDGELDHSSGDPDSRAEEGMDELDVAMSEPGPSEAQAAFKIWGGGLPLKRKRERTDLFAEKQREDRRLDQQCKNVDIKGFLSAGVLLYNSRGYCFGWDLRDRMGDVRGLTMVGSVKITRLHGKQRCVSAKKRPE